MPVSSRPRLRRPSTASICAVDAAGTRCNTHFVSSCRLMYHRRRFCAVFFFIDVSNEQFGRTFTLKEAVALVCPCRTCGMRAREGASPHRVGESAMRGRGRIPLDAPELSAFPSASRLQDSAGKGSRFARQCRYMLHIPSSRPDRRAR